MPHVAIIGAGITGVTTAYALLERGCDVTLIDRHPYAAMETSFANGGQLSASNAEVWNSWGTVVKGMKWMFQRDAPLLMNPFPSAHKYGWMAEFVGNIGKYRANTLATTRLAIEARKHLFAIAEREQIDFDHVTRGILHIYHDAKSLNQARTVNALLNEAGLERHLVSPDEIRAIEPTIAGRLAGGFYTPSDSTGDIHKFTTGLAEVCRRRGARLLLGHSVRAVNQSAPYELRCTSAAGDHVTVTADAVVVCAGVASKQVGDWFGDRVNVYPVKGYSITVQLDDAVSQEAAPWTSLLDESAKIVTSRLGRDRFRVAGTAEFNGVNRDIRHDRIQPLVDWTRRLFPGVSTERVVPWAGLRPMMPDMMPRVGRGRQQGVFYNTGHGHLGWTLSAATAELVANGVAGELRA